MSNQLNIDSKLIESAKLTAIGKSIPRLSIVVEEGKRLISNQMVLEEIPISPTKLGNVIEQKYKLSFSLSAQKINKALEKAGLQRREQHKKSRWELTDKGKEFGQLQMDTAKNHSKTVFCIRWFTEVIPLIKDYLV